MSALASANSAVSLNRSFFHSDLQQYQFYSKFARWRDDLGRRETWPELVCQRVMPFLRGKVQARGTDLPEQTWSWLERMCLTLQATPAMRTIQMAGPALARCEVGVFNCAYMPLCDLFSLPEMLYILMQGTGVGFSVEARYVSQLPRVAYQQRHPVETIQVEDSTEGWCDAYYQALQRWFDGWDVQFDTSRVRPAGARLYTKGGRASGPGPFLELMQFARNVVLGNQGKHLADSDLHRLACFTGRIVQVGGVRRAATISLSDLDSEPMRLIKSGSWWADTTYWSDGLYLTMANNSAVYDGKPSRELFDAEWQALVDSRSGERGIFNRQAALLYRPERRKPAVFGTNPCAEIILRPYEFCNLTIAVARPDDTRDTLREKVRAATYFGVIQSLCDRFNYIRPDWHRNVCEERLLGVDITGHADCPLVRAGAPGRAELLAHLRQEVADVARHLAGLFGINYSAANTTVKPSGDSAVLFDCASGVSPRFARFQRRWVREAKDSPMARFLLAQGVPHAPAPESPDRLLVFAFPKESPAGATLRDDLTAIEQLENWLEWKQHWSEHSVSATIYVEDHEWPAVGDWVYQHFDHITGLSFLPKDNGVYAYAPNEELTEAEYRQFRTTFPQIDWSQLANYEQEDCTDVRATAACANGACSF